MTLVCLCFRAHRAWRFRDYNYFDVGRRHDYFGLEENRRRVERLASHRYGPAARLLSTLLERHPGFAFALGLSSPLIDQLQAFAPDVVAEFRGLFRTGRVEPLASTSHRSLAWTVSPRESERQILRHREHLREAFGKTAAFFGGEPMTDLPTLAAFLETHDFRGIVLEGGPAGEDADASAWRRAPTARGLPLLMTRPPRFDRRLAEPPGSVLCLSMDVEVLAASDAGAGLSAAFADWVGAISGRRDVSFATPSEAVERSRPGDRSPGAGVPSARATNELQRDAWERLASLEPAFGDGGAGPEAEDFRRLTSADHFERMALRPAGSSPASRDPDVPYEAYMVFRHALEDLGRRQISPLRPLESGARQPAV